MTETYLEQDTVRAGDKMSQLLFVFAALKGKEISEVLQFLDRETLRDEHEGRGAGLHPAWNGVGGQGEDSAL